MEHSKTDTKEVTRTDTASDENNDKMHNVDSITNGEVKPKVHFNLLAAIGMQYSLTSAPIAIGFYLSMVVGLGGSPGYFWGFIVTGIFQLFVCLAICELASAIPHSSGPAHWVVVLAGPRYSRGLGYIMGWLTNAGWFFIYSSSILYPAQLIMALIEATHPTYVANSWHTYLLYIAISVVYLVLNLPRIFKVMNGLLMAVAVLINFTALYLFISLLVRSSSKQSAHFVFVDYISSSGWPDGATFFIALLPAYACLAGFDNATHITDELENPSKQVPQVLLGSYLMSFFTAVPMILVYEFCNVDPESLLESVGDQPLTQLMLNAYHSDAMTIFGMTMIIICISIAGCSCLISWSRLYWSFSREGALPFSGTMSKLSSTDSLPLNALLWNNFLAIAIGAITLGSYTAMNALLGAANLCIIPAMATALGLTLYRGRKTLNPDRWFKLGGWWGDAIFWVALLWSIFMAIMFTFPLYLPVQPAYMNWTSVVFCGVIVLSGIYWVAIFSKNKVVHHHSHDSEHQLENHAPQDA